MADTEEADTVSTQRVGNSKSTRMRSRNWSITWFDYPTNHLQILDTKTHQYVGQVEKCPKSGRLHLQIGVAFTNAVGPKHVQACFPGSHHEPARSWEHLKAYCSKEDSRAGEQFTNIKTARKIIDPLQNRVAYPWQEEILNLVSAHATEEQARSVHWYWEPTGGRGKTTLARSLCLKYPNEVIYVNGSGRDVLFALASAIAGGDDIRAVVYGINRGARADYDVLESLGDQIFFSPKYESKMILFAPIHVIVFANIPPESGHLSKGRIIEKRIDSLTDAA